MQELLHPFKAELWPVFYQFFDYTSQSKRVKFFSEPLIRELWPKFLAVQRDEVQALLKQARTNDFGAPRGFDSWLQEVSWTQSMTGCMIIP